jgi:hypothetical protein
MGSVRSAAVALACVVWAVTPGWAQSVDEAGALPSHALALPEPALLPTELPDQVLRLEELKLWIHDYNEWKRWADKWLNKHEWSWFGVAPRRPRPDPPVWLEDDCRLVLEDTGTLAEGCRLLADWRDDLATAAERAKFNAAKMRLEDRTKTSWWEHLHLDGFWPMTQSEGGMYGVVGVHATVQIVNRFQVFVAPGVMLMRVPSSSGESEWRPATDWGASYRLFNFSMPGTTRRATLHANFVRAWVFVRLGGNLGGTSTVNLAGFSVSFK